MLYGRNRQEIESLVTLLGYLVMMYIWNLDLINVLVYQLIEIKFRSKFTFPWERLYPLAKEEFINTLGCVSLTLLKWIPFATRIFKRCRNVLQTQLNTGNKVKSFNMFAVPIIWYSAALLGWTLSEFTNIERKFRNVLTVHGAHHLKSDVVEGVLYQLLMLLNMRKGFCKSLIQH